MMVVALADLEPWPNENASDDANDRFHLLAATAANIGLVSRAVTPGEWRHAGIPADALPDLAEAIDWEGRRTDRRQVSIAGRTNWRSIRRHPDRARTQLLARVDRHLPDTP